MAKILVNGEWFEELSSTSYYEAQFEQIVIDQARFLYPEYHVVPFKVSVVSDDDAAKPDLALIDKYYRFWWVVEVEMAHHSFEQHVIPQVRTLSRAYYRDAEAAHLCSKCSLLDLDQCKDMMKGKQPRVLVILNAPKPDWIKPLNDFNAIVAVLQIFRSEKNVQIYRVNGEHPAMSPDVLSECCFDRLLPRMLLIESPAGVGVPKGGRTKVYYENTVSEWERIDAQDKVWFSPIKANPLSTAYSYELLRNADGTLTLRERRRL